MEGAAALMQDAVWGGHDHDVDRCAACEILLVKDNRCLHSFTVLEVPIGIRRDRMTLRLYGGGDVHGSRNWNRQNV